MHAPATKMLYSMETDMHPITNAYRNYQVVAFLPGSTKYTFICSFSIKCADSQVIYDNTENG